MTLETILQSYSKKGHGQCANYEVKGAFAGEKVLIEPTKRKKRGKKLALLKEILEPSKQRIEPYCDHATTCGGCSWQALSYREQLRIKQKIIEDLFSEFSEVEPICAGPQHSYRSKMQYSFSQDLAGNKYLGLIQKEGKGRVLNLKMCTISDPWFTRILVNARRWFESSQLEAFHTRKNTGSLRELTLRKGHNSDSKMVILTVAGSQVPSKVELDRFVEALEIDDSTSVFLLIHSAIKGKKTEFFELHLAGPTILEEKLTVLDKTYLFSISAQAFFQPNVAMAEKMLCKIIETLPKKAESVVDLCCGIGTIGICLSGYVKEVVGAEIMAEAVCDARDNIKLNGIENMRVLKSSMKDFAFCQKPDCIIVDPPREGIHPNTLKAIAESGAEQISYLSCNPRTQAEDVKVLMEAGYKIKHVFPFDQFAHTPHIENLVILTRS